MPTTDISNKEISKKLRSKLGSTNWDKRMRKSWGFKQQNQTEIEALREKLYNRLLKALKWIDMNNQLEDMGFFR